MGCSTSRRLVAVTRAGCRWGARGRGHCLLGAEGGCGTACVRYSGSGRWNWVPWGCIVLVMSCAWAEESGWLCVVLEGFIWLRYTWLHFVCACFVERPSAHGLPTLARQTLHPH